MGFEAKVLADSVSPAGQRLTTLEATFPRFVLAEFNTHRVFSRNSASSRAIPVAKQLRRVLDDPYVPIEFGSNKPGMQAGPALAGANRDAAEREWVGGRRAGKGGPAAPRRRRPPRARVDHQPRERRRVRRPARLFGGGAGAAESTAQRVAERPQAGRQPPAGAVHVAHRDRLLDDLGQLLQPPLPSRRPAGDPADRDEDARRDRALSPDPLGPRPIAPAISW